MSARFATFQATIGNDRNGEISALDALARNGRFRPNLAVRTRSTQGQEFTHLRRSLQSS
jgi:hypothetical protein